MFFLIVKWKSLGEGWIASRRRSSYCSSFFHILQMLWPLLVSVQLFMDALLLCTSEHNSKPPHLPADLEDEQWWRQTLICHVVASLLRRLWALNEESWCKSWEVKVPEEVINIGYRVITGNFCNSSLQRDHSGRLKYLLLALCNYRKQTNKQKKGCDFEI